MYVVKLVKNLHLYFKLMLRTIVIINVRDIFTYFHIPHL